MKHLRTVFLIVLCALMLFPISCKVNVNHTSHAEATPEERQVSLDAIFSEPTDEQGNRLVYITRDPFTAQEIHDAFLEQYGYSPEPYEDESRYQAEIIPAIEAAMEEQYGIENAHSAEFGRELYDYPISPIKKAIQESAEQYRSHRIGLISSLYTERCNQFLSDYKIPKENVEYLGTLTGNIIANVSYEQIIEIAKDESVIELSFWEKIEGKCSVSNSTNQINADSAFGNNSN